MTRRVWAEYIVGGTSGLILLSSIAHGWPGWTGLREALSGHVEPALIRAVGIGWHFGSMSMAVFGLLGLRSAVLLRRGVVEARSTPLLVGAGYAVFGVWALASSHLRPHFLFFLVLGVLLLLGGLLWSPGRAAGASGETHHA